MNRRQFFPILGSIAAIGASCAEEASGPWRLFKAAVLAKMLDEREPPVIVCVGFPVLYRQKHIPHAELAGPASKPEGIAQLKESVAKLPKNTQIVIYCGCCPMVQCPNIRPAYRSLKELGYMNVSVLDLPTNFHTDWEGKGYPVESSLPSR